MGRVSYAHGFISTLAELLKLFHKLLNKNVSFTWGEEQQATFYKVKGVLSLHLTMISSLKGLSLALYLTSNYKSISLLLV